MQNLPNLTYGKFYHIYNRGNNGENIFIEERNYSYFLGLYEKYIVPIADTLAFCLLKNHFHLFVKIKSEAEILRGLDLQGLKDLEGQNLPEPSNQFSKLFNAYAKAINKGYHRTGALFEKRFKRKEVTSYTYFKALLHYIHFNPQKHGFVKDYKEYVYSSYNIILSETQTKLDRVTVLNWFQNREMYKLYHQNKVDEKTIMFFIEDDYDFETETFKVSKTLKV